MRVVDARRQGAEGNLDQLADGIFEILNGGALATLDQRVAEGGGEGVIERRGRLDVGEDIAGEDELARAVSERDDGGFQLGGVNDGAVINDLEVAAGGGGERGALLLRQRGEIEGSFGRVVVGLGQEGAT